MFPFYKFQGDILHENFSKYLKIRKIRECTAYAEKNGITIVKHYIDRAISAKTDNRPKFQQMIKDSDKKLFDIVLVWKLDRFARNRYDSARYKTQLKKNGVKLMSATEIISEGPEGIILESVLEGYAEYYSADLSEKVIRGMTENALKGKFTGCAIPFGYIINADHRFEIDPLTAPFVAETFQRYNDGQTMREIRDWLNEKGVKNQRGGLMTFNVIQHMLSNRRYIGELKYRDVSIPDTIPSIVSVELFNDVQEKMLKNKKAPARRKAEDDYLLTIKLFCGYCGALMFGESGTSRTGEVHRYYKCATAKKHKSCKKKTVRKQWLEDLVVNQTMQLVKDDAAKRQLSKETVVFLLRPSFWKHSSMRIRGLEQHGPACTYLPGCRMRQSSGSQGDGIAVFSPSYGTKNRSMLTCSIRSSVSFLSMPPA